MFLESINKVKILIKREKNGETIYPFHLFLLERSKTSGKYIIPGFRTEDIPSNIIVKTEQSFRSFCKYYIQTKMIESCESISSSFVFEKFYTERNTKTLFVTLSQNDLSVMFKQAYCFSLLSEILNERKIYSVPICQSVTEFFTRNFSNFLIHDNELDLPLPLPYALYKSVSSDDLAFSLHFPLQRQKNNKFIFSFFNENTSLRFAVFLENFSCEEGNIVDTYFCSHSEIEVNERNQFSLLSVK